MNTRNLSLISHLRDGSRTVSTIACAVTIAFTMLILAPTAQAVQNELNAPPPPPPATAEARMSAHLADVEERLRQWQAALQPGTFAPVIEAERGRRALPEMRSELALLDGQVREGFAALDAWVQGQLRQQGTASADADADQANAVADLLQTRQRKLVEGYEQAYRSFNQRLEALQQSVGTKGEQAALNKIIAFLDDHPSKRAQRPFDPHDLPFTNLQPLPDNTPRSDAQRFVIDLAPPAGVTANSGTAAAPKPGPAVVAAADFSDPQWLIESDEVVINAAIQAKAAELDQDPVKIYHWVRNNIDWLPTWGAQQDADITLGSGRGNAFDQASLLIALLRAADIPARYAIGTIEVDAERFRNWAGGFDDINSGIALASSGGIPIAGVTQGSRIRAVQMEHVWVEAALDYQPSRGARNIEADSWVALDPSFKQYEFLEGLDPIEIAGLDAEQLAQDFVDSGTINEGESWVTGFDPQILEDAQQQLQDALEQFIEDNFNDPTVGDVIGGRKVIVQDFPEVPGNLPNRVLVDGARFAAVPEALQQSITLGFGLTHSGFPIQPITIPWAKVNNHKLTLSFSPATEADEQALAALIPEDAQTIDDLPTSLPSLIEVVPELKLDGEVIHTGTMGRNLGEELTLFNAVHFPGRGNATRPLSVIVGSYLAIGSESGSISSQNLEALRQKVEQTKTILETEDPDQIATLDREDLLGDLFHAGMLGYYAQYTALGNLMGLQSDGQMMLLAGMGLHGYEPRVNTLFGFPRSISPGGVIFDLPIAGVQLTDGLEQEATARFNQQIGLLSSALEHATPEQMFSTEDQPADAISAVKALSKANAQGQRIYQLTQANMAETLPNLNLAIETEDEIRTALNAGLTVIAHTDNVSVPGWSGAGYIIFDPETGSGAYKISGGANGSFLAGFAFSTFLLLNLSIYLTPAVLVTPALLAVAVVAAVGTLLSYVQGLLAAGPFDMACFISGLVAPIAIFALAVPGLFGTIVGVIGVAIGYTPVSLPTPFECLRG